MAKKPNPVPVAVPVVEVVPVPPPVVVPAEPVADAGVSLYRDRAGAPISTGLTEGSSNFATMTESARSVLPKE